MSSNLSISGLASGMDWKTVVTQLADAARSAEKPWLTQQSLLNTKSSAFDSLKTDLATLQADVKALQDASLYQSAAVQSSAATIGTGTVANGATAGSYNFNISQLATTAKLNGTANVSQVLAPGGNLANVTLGTAGFATPVTAGVFTINGSRITIAATDSLQSVFDQISATAGVTPTYNATTDKITFTSNTPGQEIVLGSATDTSNFFQAAQLFNNASGTITSSVALGGVRLGAAMASANLATAITGDASGQGQFMVNGVSIDYDVNVDTISNVLERINSSTAGVTASYDAQNNRFQLTNKATGDMGISLQSVAGKGNFLTATGLTGGALVHGKNLLYTLNGGTQTLISQSNTINQDSSGITGLSVTALKEGAVTLTVSSDTAKISSAIQKFIKDFNVVQTAITAQQIVTTGSAGKVTPGTLTGDTTASEIASGLRATAFSQVAGLAGTIQMLSGLGIQTNGKDNTLVMKDTLTLDKALTENLRDVKAFFSDATNGWATKLNGYLDRTLGEEGTIANRKTTLTRQNENLTKQIAALEKKIASDSETWTKAFQAMETAQAKINQQMAYLTQQLASTKSN